MNDDDKTPLIDDPDIKWATRAAGVDWSKRTGEPNKVTCIYGHASYRSHAAFVIAHEAIIAQTPCPHPDCGTHHMSRMSVPHAYEFR